MRLRSRQIVMHAARFRRRGHALALCLWRCAERGGRPPCVFLLMFISSAAWGEREKFPEGPIAKIEFEGNATITPDKIKPKLLSRVGQPLNQDKVEADLKTLMGTKWFSDVRYYLDESPPKSGKWALIFVVREMPLLTKVEFRGPEARSLEGDRGHDRAKGRQPCRSDADPAGGLARSSGSIRRKGYDLASVTLLEGGNAGDTKIVIEIFEGPKVKVNSIDFVGNQFASRCHAARPRSARGSRSLASLANTTATCSMKTARSSSITTMHNGFFEVKVTPVTRPGAEPRAGRADVRGLRGNAIQGSQRDHRRKHQAQDREADARTSSCTRASRS